MIDRKKLPGIGLDAVGDRVGHVFLGDHADHVGSAWRAVRAAHDHRHDGVTSPHPADDLERGFILSYHREVSAGDIAQAQSRLGAFQTPAEPRVDTNYAIDVVFIGHYDVA